MDPVPEQMALARAVGADRVELYTEPYAAAWGSRRQDEQLLPLRGGAAQARWMPAWASMPGTT
jgi:pyridoxine 5-phosphate synthase